MSETKMKYDWDDAKSCYEAGMFYFQNAEGNRDKRKETCHKGFRNELVCPERIPFGKFIKF